MLHKDEKKAEVERIRADTDDWQMMSRWPATIIAFVLLSLGMYDLVTGQIHGWRSAGVLLFGLFMASNAVWGWHVYYRRKQKRRV